MSSRKNRIRIKALLSGQYSDQNVTVCAWVKSKRESKAFAFVVVSDGSTQQDLQIVVDQGSEAFSELARIQTGASLRAQGVVKASQGKGQAWELHASQIEVLGEADPELYPLQKKGHTLEFLRDIAHLRCRTNTFGAVFRVRHELSQLVHQFFSERGFFWVHTPIVTASDCEGAGEMFTVTTFDMLHAPRVEGRIDYSQDFFGKHAHLTVSGQLEGETFACGMGDVYTFGPTFRAENSNTTRHLAEFWMIEPEMAFADLEDDSALAEDFLGYLFTNIVKRCPDELGFLFKHYQFMDPAELDRLGKQKFHRLTYTEAVDILLKSSRRFEFPVQWGIDLQSEHERFLTDEVCKGPVIVTNYPKGIKAFYMKLNDDEKTVAAMDVLAPRIGEIIGGSQREDRFDQLKARMQAAKIPEEELWWYLDLRRFGSVPHAGFGLGFERLVQYVTGMANIRDAIPYPRFPKGIAF